MAADPLALRTLPGLRTLRSSRFRLVLATVLWLVGSAVLLTVLLRQAADPAGQFGVDFSAYQHAAEAVASGASPYAADQLDAPFAVQGLDRYLYPPLLAQALVPLTGWPETTAAVAWLLLQYVAIIVATWLALGSGGATRTPERLAWSLVAATYFLPVFDTLWKGNVSGLLALAVASLAVGGAVAGVALSGSILLKVVTVVFVPATLAMGRRAIGAALITGAVLLVPSILLAPDPWLEYLRVLPNLALGSADQATNLSPWAVVARLGAPDRVADGARIASLLVAAGCALAAPVVLLRRGDARGRHAAVILATVALLLLPAACWYHYLVVLLPIAALAWPTAAAGARIASLLGAALISLALLWLPLAVVGAVLVVASALATTMGTASVASSRPIPASQGDATR